MERVQRLYDCITEVSDQFVQEAETHEIRQVKTLHINWKRWSSIAAALAVVVGVGLAVGQLGGGGASDSSKPAMSAPAASAPAAEDVEAPAATEEPGLTGDHGAGALTGDWAVYTSLEELVAAADVIMEGRVVEIHEDVELNISSRPEPMMRSYTVVDVEVIGAFKGEVEEGEVLAIKLSLDTEKRVEPGSEWICFLEGRVVEIHEDVELNISSRPEPMMRSYTVVDVEVIGAFKGEVEEGEVLAIKLSLDTEKRVEPGSEWICFLEDYRDEQPDMPFSPLNPQQGITVVDSNGRVLVDEDLLPEFRNDGSRMERKEFVDRVKSYIPE